MAFSMDSCKVIVRTERLIGWGSCILGVSVISSYVLIKLSWLRCLVCFLMATQSILFKASFLMGDAHDEA